MSGETNLAVLLNSMQPTLLDGEYVFITLANGRYGDAQELEPIGMYLEQEGMTLIVPKAKADQFAFKYDLVFNCITLEVHSSLDAVGLTAAFSNKLAQKGLSANVIAGFYHDHIFVQKDKAALALAALREFGEKS